MEPRAMTRRVVALVVAAAIAMAAAVAHAQGPAGSGKTGEAMRTLRTTMSAEIEAGNEAAARGSLRTALEHFQRLKALLDEERRMLEAEAESLIGTEEADGIKRRIADNREEAAEVASMLSLLRVASARK